MVQTRDSEYIGSRMLRLELPTRRLRGRAKRFVDVVKEDRNEKKCISKMAENAVVPMPGLRWRCEFTPRRKKKKTWRSLVVVVVMSHRLGPSGCEVRVGL